MIHDPIHTTAAHLIWQRPDGAGSRDRLPVAIMRQCGEEVSFDYLHGTPEFERARREGFDGYIGIPLGRGDTSDAITILGRRLLSKDRSDYAEYLSRFGISPDHNLPVLSLLCYTGARMTSDSFTVSDTFEGFDRPFEYIFDVAGRRHYIETTPNAMVDDVVRFECDDQNQFDDKAVLLRDMEGATIGYINRCQAPKVREWLTRGAIEAHVFRTNGTPTQPRLFVKAHITPKL